MSEQPELLTPAEVAKRLRITPKKVMELRRVNGWPYVKLGRSIRFTPQQVEQIIGKQSVTPSASTADALPGQTAASARRSA